MILSSNRSAIAGGAITLVLLLLSTGCTDSADQGSTEVQEVPIGAVLSLTGSGAEFGKDELVGARIAVAEINAKSDSVQFELLVEDSRSDASEGVSAYRNIMTSTPEPIATISVLSSVCSALVPLVQKDKIPLFCVGAAPKLTEGNEYVFRSLPTSSYQADQLVRETKDVLEYDNVGVLYVNDTFGNAMKSSFVSTAKQNGIEITGTQSVQVESSDYRASLSKLIAADPDAMFIAAFGSGLGSAVKQLRSLGYDGLLLTTLEIGYSKVLDVAGEAANGAYYVTTRFDPSSPSDSMVAAFVNKFKKRANRSPSLDAALAYDEIKMIYRAGQKNKFTSSGIQKGLLGIENYPSLNGPASVQSDGDVAYDLVLKKIKNEQGVVVEPDTVMAEAAK